MDVPASEAAVHEAFLAATSPHLDAVWSVAWRLTGDRFAAEEVVQETFLRAYRSFGSQGRGELRAWLVTIAWNVVRGDRRRSLRRPREELGAEIASWDSGVDVAESALGRLDRDAVARALAALAEPQRAAVTLVDIGGLTSREAADVAGVPLGTMLSRVHRGRRNLAVLLTRDGVSHGRG